MTGSTSPMHVVVVGAGIGGLSCAIACRRANPPLQVTVLERVPEILTIGAGIHVPPNATKILTELGLLEKLKAARAHVQQYFRLRRWEDGRALADREIGARAAAEYGAEWLVLQRGDYQEVLVQAALKLGAKIMVGANVIGIESKEDGKQSVQLKDGTTVAGDVVIGADGLWSTTRNLISSQPIEPRKLGHVAFRATFSRDDVKSLQSERLEKIMEQSDTQVWVGFGKHVVFYPLRNHEQFNLVFIVTDEGAAEVPESFNPLQELRANFQDWDPILMQIISVMKGGLKWQLYHVDELESWTKGATALLGDACHPSLPYQGQGAAMAVEDGAVLGVLLGNLQSNSDKSGSVANANDIADVLKLYESIRKRRSQDNVDGALHNGYYYHLPDGEEQEKRDRDLEVVARQDWRGKCSFNWGDAEYQQTLLGFDVLGDAEEKFSQWWTARQASTTN